MSQSLDISCPLCSTLGEPFSGDAFWSCPTCGGIFRPPWQRPLPNEEKARYEEHNNDVNDDGYRRFVAPITSRILASYRPSDKGLDFGSGTGPVISVVLEEAGYDITQFDPFFRDDRAALERHYDYIACCEVVEHFHDPATEFARLHGLLLPGGRLYIMTFLYDESIDFKGWHYQRDSTHVFIFRKQTMEWIAERFGFTSVSFDGRLVVLDR
ncbi:MAG: class I SAM-dependent methyltransferase [Bacteroidetes bacterium]|nr:class I SAM-dependent methyltransferase [Bacteroidota bacterium]MDA1333002.1 class I SAM-dependent methyltransferase [Bacteroidota bacterium]